MVIAYLRVSTIRQHLDNQRGEIMRYVLKENIVVNRWITETVSGKTDRNDRRLGRVIKILRSGDTLIVTELSRLSRSLHEIMVIMKHCVDNKITIHSTKDGYIFDDSLNSKVLSFAFGLAAEIEHKLISQRTKEALALRKAQGKHIGRLKGTDFKSQQLVTQKNQILLAIDSGDKMVDLYKKFDVSQFTFTKLRKRYPEIETAILSRKTKCFDKIDFDKE